MRRRTLLALIGAAMVPALGMAWHARPARGFVWRHDDPDFGGLSAIHLWPDGRRFLALSDRARFFEGQLKRDADDEIVGAQIARNGVLKGPGGRDLRKRETDSEGIAVAADGTVYVSFEGPGGGRVWRYARIDGPAEELPRPEAFKAMRVNSSLEALAIDAKGRLYTLPEDKKAQSFPLWRFDGTWSQIGTVPRRGDFFPVGADFGPDGRLYLLERRFVMPVGFASRLTVLIPDDLNRFETIWESRLGQFDNLEGLSLTATPDGLLRATMVSDDNFLRIQRTELVEVLFEPALPAG